MKRVYEFEVIIPDVVFARFGDYAIFRLLSAFDVKLERKGSTDCQTEYLVTAPSIAVASAVRSLSFGLKTLVIASSSASDKIRITSNWLIGSIREVEYD